MRLSVSITSAFAGAINMVPLAVRDFIRERTNELIGVTAVLGAVWSAVALASWSPRDPSLNNATTATPQNWLGEDGAMVADLMIQVAGIAAAVPVLVMAVWGARLIVHLEIERIGLRLLALSAATLGLACAASLFPLSVLPGAGGASGAMVLAFATNIAGDIVAPVIALLAGAGGMLLAAWAMPVSIDQIARTAPWLVDFVREVAWRLRPATAAIGGTIKATTLLLVRFFSRGDDDDAPDRGDRREPVFGQRRRDEAAGRNGPVGIAGPDDSPTVSKRVTRISKPVRESKRAAAEREPTLDLVPNADYELPPLSLLSKPIARQGETISDEALQQNARILESVLEDFGIRGEIIEVRPGPVVTMYELQPAPGIKSSRVIGLADDIARSMSAVSARVAVVPGRNVIGIELPNAKRETVFLRELLASTDYEATATHLGLALGKDIAGEPVIRDLSRMPHLLIAGTTGSGKSVGINTMILSLLYRLSPDQCKLILIDPKMLELSVYDGIPHLLSPVVTDPKKAVVALKWVVREMEERYKIMSKLGVRNIEGYNTRVAEALENEEMLSRTVQTGFDPDTGSPVYEDEQMEPTPMPFIVVVVDEMADLMMVAGKEIEGAVQRLAQMARAAGIHMITATQRPSVDVITGTIKANFPTRISFQVTSKIDSRTILGEQGAEQLLGQGDMLYMAGGGRIRRVHGPFVSDEEVEKVVHFLKKQGAPQYLEQITAEPEDGGDSMFGTGVADGSGDELYDKAIAIVAQDKRASTSYIQRKLQIGYNRAARLIERMEEEGIVSGPNHAGKREVLIGEIGSGDHAY
ncbi:DNA translocase FtsK 4TM domain-containing protein [Pyruvatibacter sp.]|uniref:DNA translocase FtsK n=1 Tax=Pyruvatibacter sp. TaxID=1981328 RepID=UPI0032EEE862